MLIEIIFNNKTKEINHCLINPLLDAPVLKSIALKTPNGDLSNAILDLTEEQKNFIFNTDGEPAIKIINNFVVDNNRLAKTTAKQSLPDGLISVGLKKK